MLELAGCKMGLEIDFGVQKSEAAKLQVATSFTKRNHVGVVFGKLCLSDC